MMQLKMSDKIAEIIFFLIYNNKLKHSKALHIYIIIIINNNTRPIKYIRLE